MSRAGYENWDDDSQARGARRRSRTEEQQDEGRGSDPYGYSSPGYGSADGYAGSDDYGQAYAGDQAYGDYPQNGYGDQGNGYANGYGQNGYADNGYGGSQYADEGFGADGYGSPDPYSAQDPYGAEDPYGAADQYGGPASGLLPGQPSGLLPGQPDPRASSGPYRRGSDQYESAEGPGYGGRDAYSGAASYGKDDYGAGQYGAGGHGNTGQSRRSSVKAVDPDDARHEGFFSGFGQDDDFGGGGRPRKGGPRGPREPREHKSHAGLIALAIVVVIFGGIAGVGYHYYSDYKQRHSSYVGSGFGSVTVIVKSGDTADTIAPELLSKGVIKSIDPWASYVANKTGLQPGEFKLHEHMSPAAAWALLISPKSKVNSTVTIPDGLRLDAILPKLAKESNIPLSQFQTAIKNTAALGLPSWANGNPEGFLYPDTYDIVPGVTTALQILQDAVKEFNTQVTSLNLAAAAQQAQFTELQVVTEASLLEAEVGPSYFTSVARVIDNRLNQGMDLQLDSTVAYATGKFTFNLTASDLQVNSPYNTFIHSDLPPGPIDSPDATAIEAVLHPAQGNWLYFVTINKSGLTEFTNSNAQFQTWSTEAKQNGV